MDIQFLISKVNSERSSPKLFVWDTKTLLNTLHASGIKMSSRTLDRKLRLNFLPKPIMVEDIKDQFGSSPNALIVKNWYQEARRKRRISLVFQRVNVQQDDLLMVNDGRGSRKWALFEREAGVKDIVAFFQSLYDIYGKEIFIWPSGAGLTVLRDLEKNNFTELSELKQRGQCQFMTAVFPLKPQKNFFSQPIKERTNNMPHLSHLEELESQSIHIMREVVAQSENPVMLYSIGKDSSVMLRLAEKAFYPSPLPFPLLHVDTRWKFQAMYEFREKVSKKPGIEMLVYINPDGREKNINPFDHGSALHTDIMKTQALKKALDLYGFDAAFGGARRDEETSRAKERIISVRNRFHQWDPKNQRPELWDIYNGLKQQGESLRVFPLSNWTELDIWQYILLEKIPIVPLYFAEDRPIVERDGMIMLVDDDRLKIFPEEKIKMRKIRFRTLGCYPLTGGLESEADDLEKIILELLESKKSEREGRTIDFDASASMEKKKQEGYF